MVRLDIYTWAAGVVTGGKGNEITITQHSRVHRTTLSQWFKNKENLSAINIILPGRRS
ncbi:hypothetical protein [Streptomyces sp. NPDC005805]|uniref:hypothetical protein n=1 Tax=Streptomyces sp. NPDC005805 TaxID=3157068 RepID=UPI0033EBF68C